MTRVWYVPFEELDDKRVLGQHREAHIIYGLLSTGRKWKGLTLAQLFRVHEQSVKEMAIRGFISGFYHETPLQLSPESNGCSTLQGPTRAIQDLWPPLDHCHDSQRLLDRQDLLARWQGAYKGRAPMPDAYLPLIAQFAHGGCEHSLSYVEKLRDNTLLCLRCKHAVYVGGLWQATAWIERSTS